MQHDQIYPMSDINNDKIKKQNLGRVENKTVISVAKKKKKIIDEIYLRPSWWFYINRHDRYVIKSCKLLTRRDTQFE